LFSDQAELRNAEEWLLQLDYAATKQPEDTEQRQRFEQVKELLLKIMPEGEVDDIRCVAGSGTHPQPKVEFQTPYGWVPLRQLGYGYQTLIAWMVDFASRMVERYPNSPDPLAEPAVVLVDEIDLHLHPTWQRKLIGFLTERFPNTQFIATAHSPLVVQAAAGANFAVLRREGDHVVIDQSFRGTQHWSIEQLLTSDLFGVESPWPPAFDGLLARRTELLQRAKLSKEEKAELKQLEEQISALPAGKTWQETQEILAVTRKTQELLAKYHAK
jgi:predicted ATP-binding protein involved in virulence